MAAHCEIAALSKQFDRKELLLSRPAQGVSDFAATYLPLCQGGYVDIVADGEKTRVRLNRIHIEEDAGKLIHVEGKGDADRLSTAAACR